MLLTLEPGSRPMPPATKEDQIIRLLNELIARDIAKEGGTPKLFPFEGDVAAGATARIPCDFQHDAWVVYFREEPNATLRIWPGGSPPSSGAIELRNGSWVRLKSTSEELQLSNIGTAACHYFAFALSLAELDFGLMEASPLGEVVTLFASAARGAGVAVLGTAVAINGERPRFLFQLNVTAAATEANDTLDVFVDVLSPDLSTWVNAAHFTQVLGNGGAKRLFFILDPSAPGTAVIDATSDAAAGVVRPSVIGPQFRGRYTIVDPGVGVASFTFSLIGYAVG